MALKRDSKGRFLKRGRKKANPRKKSSSKKRRAGLKGHKPGCKCVIHARRRQANTRRTVKRAVVRARPRRTARRNFKRAKPSLFRRVVSSAVAEIRLSAKETKDYNMGGMTFDRVYSKAMRVMRGKSKGTVLVRSAGGKILSKFGKRKGSNDLYDTR